jgi:putative ABC transport system substrate-binding protein
MLLYGSAAAQSLTVLYPEIGEPYRSVFAEIIQGVEEQSRAKARAVPLAADPNTDSVDFRALRNSKVLIALGRQGLRAANALEPALGVVVGGVGVVPETERHGPISGISLSPDPSLLFGVLKTLLPGVRRVIVVYNPQSNEQLMRHARDAARNHGLELVALEAATLGAAARIYEAQFAAADSRRDAFWLPQDGVTADDSTILPLVLKESWSRSLPVFSSSVLHVRKGVLFGMYPDNLQLGRDLATLALAIQNGEAVRRDVVPLRAVRTALNTRTASHLGLRIVSSQQRNFDAIFPAP